MSRRRPSRARRRTLPKPVGVAIVAFVGLVILGAYLTSRRERVDL